MLSQSAELIQEWMWVVSGWKMGLECKYWLMLPSDWTCLQLNYMYMKLYCKTRYFRCILILQFWNGSFAAFWFAFLHFPRVLLVFTMPLMGKLNFYRYLILPFYRTCEICEKFYAYENNMVCSINLTCAVLCSGPIYLEFLMLTFYSNNSNNYTHNCTQDHCYV